MNNILNFSHENTDVMQRGMILVWSLYVGRTSTCQSVNIFVQHISQAKSLNLLLKRYYLFIFIERGSKGERQIDKHHCVKETSIFSLSTLTGHWTHNLGMCPVQEMTWWPFIFWNDVQPNEPQWSGLNYRIFIVQIKAKLPWVELYCLGLFIFQTTHNDFLHNNLNFLWSWWIDEILWEKNTK